MAIDRNELKKKVMEAAGAEEIMEIMKAAGEEITAEEAERFYEKVQDKKTDRELSLDELEAVSGGSDRNWLTQGCSATVEIGSWCWSDDTCHRIDVTYDNLPSHICSICGGIVVRNLYGYGSWKYDCIKCGDSAIVPIDTNDES